MGTFTWGTLKGFLGPIIAFFLLLTAMLFDVLWLHKRQLCMAVPLMPIWDGSFSAINPLNWFRGSASDPELKPSTWQSSMFVRKHESTGSSRLSYGGAPPAESVSVSQSARRAGKQLSRRNKWRTFEEEIALSQSLTIDGGDCRPIEEVRGGQSRPPQHGLFMPVRSPRPAGGLGSVKRTNHTALASCCAERGGWSTLIRHAGCQDQ